MLQHQIVTSPIHTKIQLQVLPRTYVAVLALMWLEEPPTTCGVPLSSMAKSSPLSVLVKLQGPQISGFLLRTHKTPHRHQAHPSKSRFLWCSQPIHMILYALQPLVHTVLNLQEHQRLAAIIGHSLYSIPPHRESSNFQR